MRPLFLSALLTLALSATAQPVQIADIKPGAPSSDTEYLEALGDDVYFSAKGPGGTELWRYVTATGVAERVTNLPGVEGGSLKPQYLVDVGGVLFFSGVDDANGRELWSYDPTTDVYGIVSDIAPGPGSSVPSFSVEFDGDLYFRAVTEVSLKELWRHDPGSGVTEQTPEIRDPGSSGPIYLAGLDGKLYFRAFTDGFGDELVRYDPVADTNTRVADMVDGPASSEPKDMTVLDGRLYYTARSTGSGPWDTLWSFDPTTDTATQLATLPTGTDPEWSPDGLMVLKDDLYFFAGSGDGADDLWRYSPATGMAGLVKDLPVGSDSQIPTPLGVIGNSLYFAASADMDGRELWKYDVAIDSVMRVGDLQPGAGSSDPSDAIVHQNALYFSAEGPLGRELWRYEPPFLLTGGEGWRTLALPEDDLTLGGEGPNGARFLLGYLQPIYTAGYLGADRDQRNRQGRANVFFFDEPTGTFVAPERADSVEPGQGFWTFIFEDDNAHQGGIQGDFPKELVTGIGTPVVGDHVYPISYTAAAPQPGINLIGNPYTEAIDWDDPSWIKTDIASTVYVWDLDYNGGDYRTWDGTTGDLEGGIIPAGQGFTVEALGETAALTVTEAAKTGAPGQLVGLVATGATGAANKSGAMRPASGVSFRLSGTVRGQDRESSAWVTLSPEASIGLDARDGRRLAGARGADALRLYTVVPEGYDGAGDALAIAALPSEIEGRVEMPMHAEALSYGEGAGAQADLAWDAATLPEGWTATLYDSATSRFYDLSQPGSAPLAIAPDDVRTASASAREKARDRANLPTAQPLRIGSKAARFTLVFSADGDAPEAVAESVLVGEIGPNPASARASLLVSLADADQVAVTVYDALGREVVRVQDGPLALGTHTLSIPAASLAPGTYVVRVSTSAGVSSRRLTVVR